MNRRQQEFAIQKLMEIFDDCTLKGIGQNLETTETLMRSLYHSWWKRSLTIAQEKKLYDFIDKKIRELIKLIKRIKKHQLPIEWKTL